MAPSEEAQLDYALGWFTHHAAQRLQTFNFYLVIATVLLLGYGTALHDKSRWFAAVLCGVGFVVTVLFFQLEVRNTELVDIGRAALAYLEGTGSLVHITADDQDRSMLAGALVDGWKPFTAGAPPYLERASWPWRQRIARHGFVLRTVLGMGAALFLCGLVLALLGTVPGGIAAHAAHAAR